MIPFYFDLDGPILDVSSKYYQVYHDLLKDEGFGVVGKDRYWEAKRSKIPEEEILRWTNAEVFYPAYKQKRIEMIETASYQEFDLLQNRAIPILESLERQFKLVLVTLRNSREQTLQQLERLEIDRFFKVVLSRSGDSEPDKWKIKVGLIKGSEINAPNCYFIGDTETDIRAAHAIGAVSFAVTNGIRSPELLRSESPDHLISGIDQLAQYF